MFRHFIAAVIATLALNAFAAVDANKATQAELESVKGIGPGLSSKILNARKTSTFKGWPDLVDRVSGIGPGNANRFSQAGLTVDGQTYVAKAGDSGKAPKASRAVKADGKSETKAMAPKPADTKTK
jgi:competence protein ComEA